MSEKQPQIKMPPRRVKTVFINRDDRRYRISFRILFTIFLILVGGVGSALSYAVIQDTQRKTHEARRDLAAQKELNAATRTDITQQYTLDEVERVAVERLEMNKPDASQIIYIHVPKQSHVVLNAGEEAPEKEYNFWDGIVNFVTETVRRLTANE